MGGLVMRLSVVLLIDVPDVPVIVTATVPAGAVALAVRVSTLLMLAGFGTNVAVTPLGNPDTAKLVLPENPFFGFIAIMIVPLFPCTTPTVFGEDESVKNGGGDPKQLLRINVKQRAEMASNAGFSISM
jgi:hypothetical protein